MPKFSSSQNTFYADLKKRINFYFDQSGKEMTGNFGLYLKENLNQLKHTDRSFIPPLTTVTSHKPISQALNFSIR